MLAVRFIGGREGGAARESKNEPEKKGRSVATELPKENAETCLGQDGTVCPGSVEDHANAAVRGGRMKSGKSTRGRPLTG